MRDFKVWSYSKTTFVCKYVSNVSFFPLVLQYSTLEAVKLLPRVSARVKTKDPSQVELNRVHSDWNRGLPCVPSHCRWVDGVKLGRSSSIHYSTQPRFFFSLSPSRSHERKAVVLRCNCVRDEDDCLNLKNKKRVGKM